MNKAQSPFSVLFYVHNVYSNYPHDSYKTKYKQILLQEEAEQKAISLFNSLNSYFNKIQSKNKFKVEVIVIDYNKNKVFEKSN